MTKITALSYLVALLASNYGVDAFAFHPTHGSKTSPVTSTSLSAKSSRSNDMTEAFGKAAMAAALSFSIIANPSPAFADGQTDKFKLPPIDKSDKTRCTIISSNMGQANAARDKLYDLRECNLSGSDASGYDLSGVIMTKTDVSKAKFVESQFSKGYLHDSTFDGADFTNGIIDRASFKGSSLRGTIFKNAVLTGTSFENADVENADFTDAYIGAFDIKNLCKNPTLKGENPVTGEDTRMSANCIN
uniref:Pentapeptide repeat-containing protein n=1 Tax=Ditylum brightwellii TaxID=49249 RepID=A0A7S4QBF2_9STRA